MQKVALIHSSLWVSSSGTQNLVQVLCTQSVIRISTSSTTPPAQQTPTQAQSPTTTSTGHQSLLPSCIHLNCVMLNRTNVQCMERGINDQPSPFSSQFVNPSVNRHIYTFYSVRSLRWFNQFNLHLVSLSLSFNPALHSLHYSCSSHTSTKIFKNLHFPLNP